MLTKRERIDLKNIAALLPDEPSDIKETVKVYGWELLRMNPISMDQNGKPVNRKKVYTVEKFKKVDHYKRMLKAYDNGGIDAVETYCDGVRDRYLKEEKEAENEIMPKLVNKTKQGYKVIPVTLLQIHQIGGLGICDSCNSGSLNFQYIGVLNSAYCQSCFKEWESVAKYYPEDIPVETKNIDFILKALGE